MRAATCRSISDRSALAALVTMEEFVSLATGEELSAADRLVTFPSTFILEKLLSALTSAGAGSEKVNATFGEDMAEGTEAEGEE